MVVVDARGDMSSGVFGDMMSTYFKGRGGAGIVIDGCMRDRPNVEKLDLPLWLRGWTPNYHVQTSIYPNAVNVPIACGGVTVIPGDIIVADDDGVVVLPVAMAEKVIEEAQKHHEWEEFSRKKLMEGAPLQRYYPLHPMRTASTRPGGKPTPKLDRFDSAGPRADHPRHRPTAARLRIDHFRGRIRDARPVCDIAFHKRERRVRL